MFFYFLIHLLTLTQPLNELEPLNTGSIEVIVTNIDNRNGDVWAALFDSEKGFPSGYTKSTLHEKGVAQNNKATVVFNNIKPGRYAIALFHDANGDKKLNTNFIGIPKEGYGFSNNPKVTFSAPGFKEAAFDHSGDSRLIIKMKYF